MMVLAKPEIALLTTLVAGMLLQSVLFFFGVSCSPWPMRIAAVAVFAGAVATGRRNAVRFVLLTGVVLGLTAFTFSYTGRDAVNYHFPQQLLLKEGWNPVWCATIGQFEQFLDGWRCSVAHTLFLPCVNALCGALVALSTGLMVADSFLNYVLFLVLFRIAGRFARHVWGCGRPAAVIFAAAIAVQTKISSFLVGQVDYLPYATLAITLLGGVLWFRERKAEDLVVLCLVSSIGMLAKTTGLLCCGFIWVVLGLMTFRDRRFWAGALTVAGFVLIIGAHPLLTNWYHYGCPFYPTMSFSPEYPPIDITADFTGNADALSMGWLSRVAYAWISPTLVVKIRSLSSAESFDPVFSVIGGVGGYGTFFRCLLLLSAVAFVLVRKNLVTALAAFVFVLSNLAPTKYIGYSRYFPQIWLIPFLAAFNALYEDWVVRVPIGWIRALRIMVLAGVSLWTSLIAVRCLAYQGQVLRLERLRQDSLAAFAQADSVALRRETENSLSCAYRVMCGGLCLDVKGSPVAVDSRQLIVGKGPVGAAISEIERRYPIVDSWRELVKYGWRSAFADLPRIVTGCQQGGLLHE